MHKLAVCGIVCALLMVGCSAPGPEHGANVSEFGVYEGYSEARFTEWLRTSQYIATRDGTKLAIDVVRPAVEGKAVDEALPVVWTHSRYHRNATAIRDHFGRLAAQGAAEPYEPGPPISFVDVSPALQRLLRHGYVFVSVSVRGGGASFGRYEGLFSPAETRDGYDAMDWIVQQPWCDGNLGMWGGSYLGITQYMAASTKHPALKAIFPSVALFDFYGAIYPGGVYRDDMVDQWGLLTRGLDVDVVPMTVDADVEGVQRTAAIAEHEDNWDVIDGLSKATFSDHSSEFSWSNHSPSEFLEEINASGVAAYHWGGWFDAFTLDELLWYANFTGPQKLAMGPWSHTSQAQASAVERAELEAIEHHRWFDYWLKGIDNGIMDEPPIHYAISDDADTWRWESAATWPPENVRPDDFYLGAGRSGSVPSSNDGLLTHDGPSGAAFDKYVVDPSTSTGTASRWDDTVGSGPMAYADQATMDAKSLTWSTPPLVGDVTLVGHPVVTLYVMSSSGDVDLHVVLEEVDAAGTSSYVTEGLVRTSHRQTTEPPWDNLGLPYQRSSSQDPRPLLDEPNEVAFDLIPTAWTFSAGNQLRLSLRGADADNTVPIDATESPTIRIFREPTRPSRVRLPVAH